MKPYVFLLVLPLLCINQANAFFSNTSKSSDGSCKVKLKGNYSDGKYFINKSGSLYFLEHVYDARYDDMEYVYDLRNCKKISEGTVNKSKAEDVLLSKGFDQIEIAADETSSDVNEWLNSKVDVKFESSKKTIFAKVTKILPDQHNALKSLLTFSKGERHTLNQNTLDVLKVSQNLVNSPTYVELIRNTNSASISPENIINRVKTLNIIDSNLSSNNFKNLKGGLKDGFEKSIKNSLFQAINERVSTHKMRGLLTIANQVESLNSSLSVYNDLNKKMFAKQVLSTKDIPHWMSINKSLDRNISRNYFKKMVNLNDFGKHLTPANFLQSIEYKNVFSNVSTKLETIKSDNYGLKVKALGKTFTITSPSRCKFSYNTSKTGNAGFFESWLGNVKDRTNYYKVYKCQGNNETFAQISRSLGYNSLSGSFLGSWNVNKFDYSRANRYQSTSTYSANSGSKKYVCKVECSGVEGFISGTRRNKFKVTTYASSYSEAQDNVRKRQVCKGTKGVYDSAWTNKKTLKSTDTLFVRSCELSY